MNYTSLKAYACFQNFSTVQKSSITVADPTTVPEIALELIMSLLKHGALDFPGIA